MATYKILCVHTQNFMCGQKARKHKGFQAFLPHKQFYVVTYKILCDHIKKNVVKKLKNTEINEIFYHIKFT